MEIGVCLPYMKADHTREIARAWCERLDAGGVSSLSCGERITGPTWEMRATLAAAAAWTERARIIASLYVLPMHDAVWAAKEAATLDVLSGGRVTLCVGVGGREDDYRAVSADFSRRHVRMAGQVERMRAIWRGEPPFPGCDPVGPRPLQADGPPILAGVMGPKAIERAGRYADGVYAWSGNGEAGEIGRILQDFDAAWAKAGRAGRPRRVGGFWFSLAPDGRAKLQQYAYEYLRVFGEAPARAIAKGMDRSDPAAVRAAVDGLEAAGCDEVILVPATNELAEVDGVLRLLADR